MYYDAMPGTPEFSIPKSELSPEKFEKYLDGEEVRSTIARNLEAAIGSDIVTNKQGIFRFDDFARRFTIDGSLKMKKRPGEVEPYNRFFSIAGRFSKRGDDYVLRGVHYLVSIDPTLEVRQKLRILWRDFNDAVDVLSLEGGVISDEHYIEQSAVLDYAKNASITLLNALIQAEKVGDFKLDDNDYQRVRNYAVDIAKASIQAYYAHFIGDRAGYERAFTRIVETYENLYFVREYIEDSYEEGVFSSRYFTRPEASHPLVIAASVCTAVQNVSPMPETIIGLPSGGTEIALAQQYAYTALKNHECDLLFVPLSLHSIKEAFGTDHVDRHGFTAYLNRYAHILRNKHILVVEDNSSTGRTIQVLHDMLRESLSVQQIQVSVAEADLIRSTINSEAAHRTHVASERVYQSAHVADQVMYRAFIAMCEHPTESLLDTLNNENAILEFRHTFLSNFYAIPIQYRGAMYPSVEHAYHAQKFTPESLARVSEESACKK